MNKTKRSILFLVVPNILLFALLMIAVNNSVDHLGAMLWGILLAVVSVLLTAMISAWLDNRVLHMRYVYIFAVLPWAYYLSSDMTTFIPVPWSYHHGPGLELTRVIRFFVNTLLCWFAFFISRYIIRNSPSSLIDKS